MNNSWGKIRKPDVDVKENSKSADDFQSKRHFIPSVIVERGGKKKNNRILPEGISAARQSEAKGPDTRVPSHLDAIVSVNSKVTLNKKKPL